MQKVISKALWAPRTVLVFIMTPIVVFGLCFSLGPPSCQKAGIVLASIAALVPFLIPFIISFFYPVVAGWFLILEIVIPFSWFLIHNRSDLDLFHFSRADWKEMLIYLLILLGGFLYSCIGIGMIKIYYSEKKKLANGETTEEKDKKMKKSKKKGLFE